MVEQWADPGGIVMIFAMSTVDVDYDLPTLTNMNQHIMLVLVVDEGGEVVKCGCYIL